MLLLVLLSSVILILKQALCCLKKKRAGEGGLLRQGHGTFRASPGGFTVEQNERMAGCLGVLWRHQLGAKRQLCDWVSA